MSFSRRPEPEETLIRGEGLAHKITITMVLGL